MNTALSLRFMLVALVVGTLSACRSVESGPATIPDPGQQGVIMGKEPAAAPIPQKNIPEGESSLRKTAADQRIDQPKH